MLLGLLDAFSASDPISNGTSLVKDGFADVFHSLHSCIRDACTRRRAAQTAKMGCQRNDSLIKHGYGQPSNNL